MLLLALACTGPVPAPPDPADPPRVVVIVLDGARLEETFGEGASDLTGAPTADLMPEVRARLFPHATLVRGALNTGVPITTEAHTELFTALRQDLATYPPGSIDTYRSDVPTIFEALRAADGLDAEQVVMVVNTVLVEDLAWSMWPTLGEDYGATHRFTTDDAGEDLTDQAILGSLRTWMSKHDTRLAFANLHGIDLAGHVGEGLAYVDRIEDVDTPLAELWEWLQATEPYAGHTTLVLLADHGRHDTDEPEAWRNHGDSCTGCRSIPLLFAGPGITEGAVVDRRSTLADVAQTIAWRLGVALPEGRGRVIGEIFEDPPTVDGPAPMAVAAEGEHRAVEDDDGIWLDGARISDPDAIHAEGPVLMSLGASLVACWRELGEDGVWVGRCTRDGQDLSVDEPSVSPRWAPALLPDGDDAFWMAWAYNPGNYTGAADVRPRLARWDGSWTLDAEAGPEASLPTHVSLARSRVDGALDVAFAEGLDEDHGRDTRRVSVWQVTGTAEQTWTRRVTYTPDPTWTRLEAPALHDGRVAMLGYGAGTTVLLAEPGKAGTEGGTVAASTLTTLDPTGRVLGRLGVQWDDDALVWARLDEAGGVELCRWDGALNTVATGAADLTGLAPTSTGWVAVLDGVLTEGDWD